ncbi:MAG: efflux RND transporter permease subunit [Hyphomicrobiales bacterium]
MISALEAILRRPRSVLTMMVVMILAGVAAYVSIPKEANPDIDVPVFYVSVVQQGISPEDAERLLVRPLETQLRGLDGLKEVTAVASEGHAGIVLEFNIDFDKDQALSDVRDKVDQAKAELPDEADEPQIFETNFSLIPTIIVAVSGDVPERTLYAHARRLKDRLEAIPSVLEADLTGHREELLEVVIDMVKLESYDITQQELLESLARNNQLVPAGFLDNGKGRFNVKVPGLVETAEDVYSLPIRQKDEGVVTLGDVAEIHRTFKDASTFTRVNGKPAIAVQVKKRVGTNIIANNDEVRKAVAEFTAGWPSSIRVNYLLDQSTFIFEVLGSLEMTILTAIFLVMIIVLAALGPRSGLLVGLAIPTSFMVGFLFLGFTGLTLNMMVMFGLVLTVGMLVDGAIVVVEYADRKIAEGMPRTEAYIRAAKLMLWPVMSSTATTLAAFLPMLLWPGVPGEFMGYLPKMVIIVLTASLLTAMVFLPVMGGLFGRKKADPHEVELARSLSGDDHFHPEWVRGLTGMYVRLLARLIRRPALVIAGALGIAVVVVMLFANHNNGVEFFVKEEPDQAVVLVSGRGNLSAVEARDLVSEVERQVLAVHGIRNVVMTSYASGGQGGGVKLGDVQDKPADMIGELQLEMSDFCCRRPATEVFEEIRERVAPLAGIKVEIRKIEGGPPTGKDIRLEVKSRNYDEVAATARRIRAAFDNTFTGLRDIEDTRPLPGIEWQLAIDREEAGRFNAAIVSVGSMVQLVTNGVMIGKYRPDDSEDEVEIRVRLPEGERNLDELDQLRLRTPNGLVPIANFVSRTAEQKVSSITRKDGLYVMTVKANVVDGVLADDKVREIQSWLDGETWPEDIIFRFRGADEEQKESGAFLMKAMLGSLFLMFIILVTEFNSFYQTFLTLSTVVMSILGVLIGMMITGQTFSIIMTGTGVVALAGIVVNNAIVLIDTYDRFRKDGIEAIEAILKTSAQRLRPILLTTITTIAGLVPMALQINFNFIERSTQIGSITAGWWVQLATAVIFGLAFSTMLTLVMIPTMLAAPTIWRESLARRGWLKPTGAAASAMIAPAGARPSEALAIAGTGTAADQGDDGQGDDARSDETGGNIVRLRDAAE